MITDEEVLALDSAETRDPGNEFVKGCRMFFNERGFLSKKQIAALDRVTKTRSRPMFGSWFDPSDSMYQDDGLGFWG